MSSKYRECEFKIYSVEDRKGQRQNTGKPHVAGAKCDVERLTKGPVVYGHDDSNPVITHYNNAVLVEDNESHQKHTSLQKKSRAQEKGTGGTTNPAEKVKRANATRSKHGLYVIFNKNEKTHLGSDKRSGKETKEQYFDRPVNHLSEITQDTHNFEPGRGMGTDTSNHTTTKDTFRKEVIRKLMNRKIKNNMEKFHECDESPHTSDKAKSYQKPILLQSRRKMRRSRVKSWLFQMCHIECIAQSQQHLTEPGEDTTPYQEL